MNAAVGTRQTKEVKGEFFSPEGEITTNGAASKGRLVSSVLKLPMKELPRLVTRHWELLGLYIPAAVAVSLAAKGAVLKELEVTVTATLQIIRANSVIYFKDLEVTLAPNAAAGEFEGGPEAHDGSLAFAEDFTNPIDIGPMDRLTLALSLTVTGRTQEGAEPENMDAKIVLGQGTFRYRIPAAD